jgi:polyphosphate kinase 2 (PPK2 family)
MKLQCTENVTVHNKSRYRAVHFNRVTGECLQSQENEKL